MSTTTPAEAKALRQEKREILRQMREQGIKRVSCFNRVDGETYRLNARLFAISVKLGR